jgi:diguanylate cyclase (GGDEF)-like protein
MERVAALDALTRLPNRQAFDERAQQLLKNAFAKNQVCAMLYIDLDDFRLLNKGYGHRIGDQMLALVSERMRSVVPEPNLLGRRGGRRAGCPAGQCVAAGVRRRKGARTDRGDFAARADL